MYVKVQPYLARKSNALNELVPLRAQWCLFYEECRAKESGLQAEGVEPYEDTKEPASSSEYRGVFEKNMSGSHQGERRPLWQVIKMQKQAVQSCIAADARRGVELMSCLAHDL